jgi:uncharacterized membrane protein
MKEYVKVISAVIGTGIGISAVAAASFEILFLWVNFWWGVNPAWVGAVGVFSPVILALLALVVGGVLAIVYSDEATG